MRIEANRPGAAEAPGGFGGEALPDAVATPFAVASVSWTTRFVSTPV